MLALNIGVLPGMSVSWEAWPPDTAEGSSSVQEADLLKVGEGVVRSGEMMELLAIFRVDIPALLVMVRCFLGEHLTGVPLLMPSGCFLGVVPPKLSLLGSSVTVLTLKLAAGLTAPDPADSTCLSTPVANSPRCKSFLGLLLSPSLC